MGALDGFYSTWNKARETFGQGVPTDGSQFDQSSSLTRMKASVEAAAPDDRWQGSGANAYAAANKEHAQVYQKLADLDQEMAAEVKNAANIVSVGRTNLDNAKGWVESMANSLSATSAQDRERKLIPIAREGISRVDNIVKTATAEMVGVKGNVEKLRGEYDTIKTSMRFGPEGEKKPGDKDAEVLGIRDDKDDGDLEPEDMDELVQEALSGNKDAASKVDEILDTIEPSQLEGRTDPASGAKIPPEKLNPVQAEVVGRLQQRMEDMSLDDLVRVKQELGDHGDILTNAMNVMSDPDVSYPRHGDAEVVSPGGGIPTSGWDTGRLDDLPAGAKDALNAELDLSGPAMSDAPVDTFFPNTEGAQKLSKLAEVMSGADTRFQQGSELDSTMMHRAHEILSSDVRGGPRVVEDIFETAGHDKVVAHDMFTDNDSFVKEVLTTEWTDDGTAATNLTDWIKQDAHSPNPDVNSRAGETARAIADYMGDPENKQRLLDMKGTQSLGEVNPALTRSLAGAMSPYLDEIAGRPSDKIGGLGLNPTTGFGEAYDGDDARAPKTVNLLTVLNTDDAAARVINARAIELQNTYINEFAQSVIDNPQFPQDSAAIDVAGKLKGVTEHALYSASSDILGDDAEAKRRMTNLIGVALDTAGAIPSPAGAAIGITSPLFKEFISSFETDKPPDVNSPVHSSVAMQTMLANTFVAAGIGPQEGIDGLTPFQSAPGRDLEIPGDPSSSRYNNFISALRNYLDNISEPVQSGIGAYNQAYRDTLP
ncbi:EspA/EspE family type VII secretion system effector [Mycolicibacterium goodii]|uniref:TPR repeat region-containing protein n=1 Tax=Mycolicibacterium goodii TaxID=134601 RepID=UPI00067376A1